VWSVSVWSVSVWSVSVWSVSVWSVSVWSVSVWSRICVAILGEMKGVNTTRPSIYMIAADTAAI
jgi:hypothetical protein